MAVATFKKCGQKDSIEVESLKMTLAHEIAERSMLFRVPQVISTGERCIETSYLPGLVPFRRSLSDRDKRLLIANKAGAALAAIHANLKLPDAWKHELPEGLRGECSDSVYIHGDFSGENVCVDQDGNIVILDWSMTPRFGGKSTYGTRYFDVCWFLCNLFRRPVYEYAFLGSLSSLASAFLQGYEAHAGMAYSPVSLVQYHRRFFEFRIMNRSSEELFPPKRLLLSSGFRAWNSYMRSL